MRLKRRNNISGPELILRAVFAKAFTMPHEIAIIPLNRSEK
jgi:hypothetical protein